MKTLGISYILDFKEKTQIKAKLGMSIQTMYCVDDSKSALPNSP